ncbi:MAG TPA: hypothetical protein DCG78_00545 [Anaerolineaceae bacterium]|nr:hypothetical protein [Anaerolineaceae bacterium]
MQTITRIPAGFLVKLLNLTADKTFMTVMVYSVKRMLGKWGKYHTNEIYTRKISFFSKKNPFELFNPIHSLIVIM